MRRWMQSRPFEDRRGHRPIEKCNLEPMVRICGAKFQVDVSFHKNRGFYCPLNFGHRISKLAIRSKQSTLEDVLIIGLQIIYLAASC